ncbi:MAG: hypothetical protein ACXWW0_00260 [Bacteroidia bacterium]
MRLLLCDIMQACMLLNTYNITATFFIHPTYKDLKVIVFPRGKGVGKPDSVHDVKLNAKDAETQLQALKDHLTSLM